MFIDEVQNVHEFEKLLEGLYVHPNIDLYVTGSNAFLLSSELATLLTGRAYEINVLPFSFVPYLLKNPSLASFHSVNDLSLFSVLRVPSIINSS